MGLRDAIQAFKWLKAANKAKNAIAGEMQPGFDGKVTIKKGAVGVLEGALAVAGLAALAFLADPDLIHTILDDAGIGHGAVVAIVPLITGGARFVMNFLKQGKDGGGDA